MTQTRCNDCGYLVDPDGRGHNVLCVDLRQARANHRDAEERLKLADRLIHAAEAKLTAAENYMAYQRLGRMPEKALDDLHKATEEYKAAQEAYR